MTELNFNNLMDLATFDTSDISAVTSRLPLAGIYLLNIEELKFTEQPPSDPADPLSFNLVIRSTVLSFAALNEDDKPAEERLPGTNITERFFIYGKDIKTSIALLMGRFKTVGFRHKGLPGGADGADPGWIDEAAGKRIVMRCRHYTRRSDGQEQAAFDWLSPKAMEKAGIPFELLQRDFLDEHGVPVEIAA